MLAGSNGGRHPLAQRYDSGTDGTGTRTHVLARIRTIKPEFFTSEDIVALSALARLLYIALWCEADKEGRLVWKPMTFKLRYMPGDDCNIQALCQEILERGLVKLYGEGLAYIPSFSAHQHINPRESASQLPGHTLPPRVGTRQPRAGTGANLNVDAQVGREGKGREVVIHACHRHCQPPRWMRKAHACRKTGLCRTPGKFGPKANVPTSMSWRRLTHFAITGFPNPARRG